MESLRTYKQKMHALLSPAERRVFAKLSTPQKIQDYLDEVAINFEESGETLQSPRALLASQRAHCIEAAMFAAASLAYHGMPPLLMDFQTDEDDEDHVVAVFKQNNRWGAISKTNHATLRWRDPVYKTARELAMSYFHEYILKSGRKTMRTYSKPFDMRRYPLERWLIAQGKLDFVAEDLDDSRHFTVVPAALRKQVRKATGIERQLLTIPEWKGKKRLIL